MGMNQNRAEALALGALGWMAEDPEIMGQFLGWSGASVDDLRGIGASPGLMIAVIDFILLQDDWVIDASRQIDIPPEKFSSIKAALPGGAETHWT